MNTQIKKTIKAGNSSAVLLPKSWLNKEVKVELVKKTPEMILLDTLEILKDNVNLEEVMGIYLTGSYARNENDKNSDIDLIVITEDTDKTIVDGMYSILLVSLHLLKQKLKSDIMPVGPMLLEAKSLMNKHLLSTLTIKLTKENIKDYLETTKEKIDLLTQIIEKTKKSGKKYIDNSVVYTLVLRIRTLKIIEKLSHGDTYSKSDLIKILVKTSKGTNPYNSYLIIKNNEKGENKTTYEEAERLLEYLKKQLKNITSTI